MTAATTACDRDLGTQPQDQVTTSKEVRAGKGNGAERLAVPQGSSDTEGCLVAQDRATEAAAQDEAKRRAAADALISLASPRHETLPTTRGSQNARGTDEGDVDGRDLNMTTASVAAKQPSQPEPGPTSHNPSPLDCSSPAPKQSGKDAKKLRKYTKTAQVQYDALLEKIRAAGQATRTCLSACNTAQYRFWNDGSIEDFVYSPYSGCRKLRQAWAATNEHDRARRQQIWTIQWGLKHLFPSHSLDEWIKAVDAMADTVSTMTKDFLDSGFFDKPPEDVKAAFRRFPTVSGYTSALSRYAESMETRFRLFRELAAFCDRKRGLESVFVDQRPDSLADLEAAGFEDMQTCAKMNLNNKFLLKIEEMTDLEPKILESVSRWDAISEQHPILERHDALDSYMEITARLMGENLKVEPGDCSSKEVNVEEEKLKTGKGAGSAEEEEKGRSAEETESVASSTVKAETEEMPSEGEEAMEAPRSN